MPTHFPKESFFNSQADDFVKNLDGSMYQSMSKTSLGFAQRSLQVNARANGFVHISLKGGPSNSSIHSWKQLLEATNATSGDLQVCFLH